jgi:steroid delta-isomerase-like uncharacterized protein
LPGHVESEKNHNVEDSIAPFHTPKYDVKPMGLIHDGSKAVADLLSGIFKGFPDFTIDVPKTYHSDDAVILEIIMKGTHLGEWAGVSPTGKFLSVPTLCIFEFDEDRLLCEKVYFDMATLMNQLNP